VDPLSSRPLGRSLGSPSDEGITVLGVAEVLAVEDLEFPVLLDKSVDDDSIIFVRGPGDGREHGCDLRCSYVLWSETMWRFCIEGRTWATTFPGASINSR